jgi:2-polyprenyl-6-methoxyphenol hydroxylase-like FAD-dependent oxidoreductase
MTQFNADIIIVGAGPVGMTAAIEAGRRGKSVTVLERRDAENPAGAKCNSVAARTMETFRSLGIADEVARAGLPDDFPTDVICATSVTGPELTRLELPSRNERGEPRFGDTKWRAAEPMVRVSQIYLEPILKRKMLATPGVTAHFKAEVLEVGQDRDGVTVNATLTDGSAVTFTGQYLLGCDGGRSLVRKTIGAKLTGDAEIARTRSSLIRAPGLKALWGKRRPAWMSWIVNSQARGIVVAIDGQDTWLVHRPLPEGETDFDAVDFDASIRAVLGVDNDFTYDVINHEDWIGRRMVADRMRDRRIFIAGDAAHLWVPFAGYGMNAGIADAMNAVWAISNVLDGWAGQGMLDAYEAERQPITEQVSRHAMQSMLDTVEALGKGPVPTAFSSRYNPAGIAMRAVMARKIGPLNEAQFLPEGLNFGYFYDRSPVIVADGVAPDFSMGSHTPSTVPGCRLPHFLVDGRPVMDLFGPAYTLLRLDPRVDVAPLVDAAKHAGMPLKLVDAVAPDGDPAFTHPLIIVRRDHHVAWRGHGMPWEPHDLVARLSGRAVN